MGRPRGRLYGSFFGQLEDWRQVDVGGQAGIVVVAIKGVLYAITLAALVATLGRRAVDGAGPSLPSS